MKLVEGKFGKHPAQPAGPELFNDLMEYIYEHAKGMQVLSVLGVLELAKLTLIEDHDLLDKLEAEED